MTRSYDGPVRGTVFALPPALLLWIPIVATLALILAAIG